MSNLRAWAVINTALIARGATLPSFWWTHCAKIASYDRSGLRVGQIPALK
jgi:hypothetical protein